MPESLTFGRWLQRRRRALDLTQAELAHQVGYAEATLRKVEADELRPSKELATRLAERLDLAPAEREAFVRFARGRAVLPELPGPSTAVPVPEPGRHDFSGSLPLPLTTLIGRQAIAASIRDRLLLGEVRLLTLTGPPGVGKTRLGLHVAADVRDEFSDGVVFVSLAEVRDPALVASTIAQPCEVRETSERSYVDSLVAHLRDKQVLLVLDNFEHVIAAALLLVDLLRGAPGLKLLVTSREALRLQPEHEYPVPPLALPESDDLGTLGAAELTSAVGQTDAVRLFVDRAQAAKPDFALTKDNARDVAEICRRLDGLPLAIELAAARIRLSPPTEMLTRLGRPASGTTLKLLRGAARDRPTRHQTLRAAIAWSCDLLSGDESTMFRRLAVFVGGATLEAVQALVADDSASVLDALESVIDKSLLLQEAGEGLEPRYAMFETIREYASEMLAASGEGELMRRKHAAYYLALAQQADAAQSGPHEKQWHDRLERDNGNLRVALSWTKSEVAQIQVGLALAGALWWFWEARGHLVEGQHHLAELLAADSAGRPTWARGKALNAAGHLACVAGDFDHARATLDEAITLWRGLGDDRGLARALATQGWVLESKHEYAAAKLAWEEALEVGRNAGDDVRVAGVLAFLARWAQHDGDLERAANLYNESIALRRKLEDDWGMAGCLYELAGMALDKKEIERAEMMYRESLELWSKLADQRALVDPVEALAWIAGARGQNERAARLFGVAAAHRARLAIAIQDVDRRALEEGVIRVRQSIAEQTFSRLWAEGETMSLQEAIAYALEHPEPTASHAPA